MRLMGTAREAIPQRAGRGTVLWERHPRKPTRHTNRLRRTGSAASTMQDTIGARAQRGKDT